MSEIADLYNESYHNNFKQVVEENKRIKAENEELCTAIRNELSEQYDKRVSEAESDIEWGVLDRNATEAEFCKNVIFETRNYITKLKQENEKLKKLNEQLATYYPQENNELLKVKLENEELRKIQIGHCQGENLYNLFQYKQCLNEIEEVAKNGVKDDCGMPLDELSIILKLIKQAKEGE